MAYAQELFSRAFWDAWDLVFNRSVASSMVGAGIFISTLVFLRCRKKHEEARKLLKDVALAFGATVCAFLVLLLVNLLVFTPRALVTAAKDEKERAIMAKQTAEEALRSAKANPLSVDIHETDSMARADIKTLRIENAKLREKVRSLDPLEQPIAMIAANASVIISSQTKNLNEHNMASGAAIGLCKGSDVLAEMDVGESYDRSLENDTVRYSALFNTPASGPLIGKPVAQLIQVEYVLMQIQAMPDNAQVVGGTASITANGNEKFDFAIPPQTAMGKRIIIRDLSTLKNGLTQSSAPMPPSQSIPDTGASPH